MATPYQLRNAISRIESLDRELAEELQSVRNNPHYKEEASRLARSFSHSTDDNLESLESGESMDVPETDNLETIVLRVGRPVLTISNNSPQLTFSDVESQVWREKLEGAKSILSTHIPAVGRIELQNHPGYEWVGTGWLVAENIVVTNRHVAEVFGRRNGQAFVFRQLTDTPVAASIDFLKEFNNPAGFVFQLKKILHIEDDRGPDIAFLSVEPLSGTILPTPVPLYTGNSAANTDVAVIGYPARDSRIPDQALMEQIFGNVYNYKRLAPGQITQAVADRIYHDCTTLGGCSGGLVLDLQRGEAVGLHFAGRFLEANFAVPASVVAQRLSTMQRTQRPATTNGMMQPDTAQTNVTSDSSKQTLKFNIPLEITISVGTPVVATTAVTPQHIPAPAEEDFYIEATPEDYVDREGYKPDFLGVHLPLPELQGAARRADILYYDRDGEQDHELRYEHFSVVMSKSRRLCFYSAVNINGAKTRKAARPGWRRDPRIAKDAQILNECYGDPPKFSRGHMTRREDPIWGTETAALRGNADSMCVTNTVPQMQSFNSPVWLGLENYALEHARKDGMKISVFTGPVFRADDPVMYGVKIPVSTWKIIAFIHDETGELSATGYKISQEDYLQEEEFVFGAYKTAQVTIESIEKMTGLSFGDLAARDPLREAELPVSELTDAGEIRFK